MKTKKQFSEMTTVQDWKYLLDIVPVQDESDKSLFTIILDELEVCAMGDEFNPDCCDMKLDEMLNFIEDGIIKIISIPKNKLTPVDLGDYTDFFDTEFWDEPTHKNLPKDYVIAKMVCGKSNAKSGFNSTS
jgi:hypothetical protein